MSFQALFYPKSIALIGASRKLKTVGNDVAKNLIKQGYKGDVYLVNPKADELYGKKVYSKVVDLPKKIDLAIIAIPAPFVADAIKEAHEQGAQAVIVISAGFKEIGNKDLEDQLSKICLERDISLVGPNCLGIINPEIKMNASFAALMPEEGNVAFISQSGALCTAVLDYAKDLGIGFSKFMSIGNKADVDELKLIKYFAEDPKTKVIAIYAEQLENASEIIKTVKSVTTGDNPKPVIVLKSGRTEAGAGAISSHTGSLSGGDTAYDSLFKQAGIIRADSVSQLFDYAQIFSKNKLTRVRNVAIITNAGGPGVLTTDEVAASGLKMAKLEDKTVAALKEILPPAASTSNPIDILGDAVGDRYQQALKVITKDEGVDSILLLLTPQSMTEIDKTAKAVIEVNKTSGKPILASFMGQETVSSGIKLMREAGVVTTTFPEPAAKALAIFGQFVDKVKRKRSAKLKYDNVNKEAVRKIFDDVGKGKHSFPEAEAIKILSAYNFSLLKTGRAGTADEALKVIKKLGATDKYAMKIVSQDILHESDADGVMLNVTAEDVQKKFVEMIKRVTKKKPKARLEGVLLMEMAPENGIEVILGVSKAPGLGTMIMVGLGGIYVEVMKDVSFGFTPLTHRDVERMIENLRSKELFKGVRGQKPADKEKLIESVGRLAQLATDFPEIIELDINPLLVLPKGEGAKSLDARVVIE